MKLMTNKKQIGQALPLGIVFIGFVGLLTLVLFNSGQLITEKTKLSNTADAAAYSGLVWQARALNFQAYTNRAMVANQVSIAQLVSINAWTEYGNIATRNVNNTIGLFPPFRPFTQGVDNAMTQINNITNMVVDIAIPVIDGVNVVLSQTQQAMYYATFAITPLLVREVVKANNENYDVDSAYAIASLGENALDWSNFTERYDDKEGLHRKAEVINRSKDEFTRGRNWDFGKFYLGVAKIELVKQGETQLVYDEEDQEWAWKGKDTLSIHTETWGCRRWSCGWRHTEIPVAWGAAYSPNDVGCSNEENGGLTAQQVAALESLGISVQDLINSGHIADCSRFFDKNRNAESLANSEAIDVGNYSGVQAYYDMADLSEENRDPRMNLRVEVQIDENNVRTSTKVGIGSQVSPDRAASEKGIGRGIFWAGDETASESMAAISTGELYFERPTYRNEYRLRINGSVKQEYGNLFNPYWHVRLVDTPNEIKMASWVIRDPSLLSGSVGGAVSGLTRYVAQQAEDLQSVQELGRYAEQEIAEISNYTAEVTRLEDQMIVYNEDIAFLESNISSLQSSGESAAVIEQQEAVLHERESERSNVSNQLQLANHALDEAQFLGQELATIEGQIQDTQNSINSGPVNIGLRSDLYMGSALSGSLTSGGMQNIQTQLMNEGEEALGEALEEELTEQLAEIIEGAVTSFVNNYGGDYASYVDTADTFYNNAELAVEETANEINENYIEPLEQQVTEMRSGLSNMRQQLRAEMEASLSLLDERIDSLRTEMEERVTEMENSIQQEISALEEERDALSDPNARQDVQDEIDLAQARLSEQRALLRRQYESQIASMENGRAEIVTGFEESAAEAEREILQDIAALEEKIEKLKSRTSRG